MGRRGAAYWILGVLVLGAGLWVGLARRATAPTETRFDPKAAALTRFEEVRGEGVDLSHGPCLGVIGPDWVADVAHDPRKPVDDEPANQCAEYREGKAAHFVELTPDGRVIRMK
mgnify:CR=1 FL=1